MKSLPPAVAVGSCDWNNHVCGTDRHYRTAVATGSRRQTWKKKGLQIVVVPVATAPDPVLITSVSMRLHHKRQSCMSTIKLLPRAGTDFTTLRSKCPAAVTNKVFRTPDHEWCSLTVMFTAGIFSASRSCVESAERNTKLNEKYTVV